MTDRIVPQEAHNPAGPGFAPPPPPFCSVVGLGPAPHATRGPIAAEELVDFLCKTCANHNIRPPARWCWGGGTTLGPGLFGRPALKVVNGVFHMRRHTRRWFMECQGLFLPCVAAGVYVWRGRRRDRRRSAANPYGEGFAAGKHSSSANHPPGECENGGPGGGHGHK